MRTPATRVAIPLLAAAALVLGACGDDGGPAATTRATTAPASSTAVTVATTPATSAPSTTAVPRATAVTTAAAATTAVATTVPGLIEVTVGVDSGPDRVERVRVGQSITLKITNPDADDEFHVHGVDLGGDDEVTRGQTRTFRFSVDTPTTIEVESHATDTVLVVIEVVA